MVGGAEIAAIAEAGKLATAIPTGATVDTDRAAIQKLLASWNATLAELRRGAYRLTQRRTEIKDEHDQATTELQDLRTGKRRYPRSTERLRELLSAELATQPHVLCEVVEVIDEKWQDAVEGYLSTRRFDLLVAPDDYDRALTLYERQKKRPKTCGGWGWSIPKRRSNSRTAFVLNRLRQWSPRKTILLAATSAFCSAMSFVVLTKAS